MEDVLFTQQYQDEQRYDLEYALELFEYNQQDFPAELMAEYERECNGKE